jgi:hypothetical protein
LFKPLSDVLGRQSGFAVPGAKKRDRCLTHSDSSCGGPRNKDRRGDGSTRLVIVSAQCRWVGTV